MKHRGTMAVDYQARSGRLLHPATVVYRVRHPYLACLRRIPGKAAFRSDSVVCLEYSPEYPHLRTCVRIRPGALRPDATPLLSVLMAAAWPEKTRLPKYP